MGLNYVEMKKPKYYQQELARIRSIIFGNHYLYEQARQAKLFIDKNYAKDIDLDEIAATAFFSKFHFIRLFKTVYDTTPHQYLTAVRIEKAKSLLESGKSISDTCSMVGFKSITWFTSLFKKATGFTPAAFQEKRYGHVPSPVLPLRLIR